MLNLPIDIGIGIGIGIEKNCQYRSSIVSNEKRWRRSSLQIYPMFQIIYTMFADRRNLPPRCLYPVFLHTILGPGVIYHTLSIPGSISPTILVPGVTYLATKAFSDSLPHLFDIVFGKVYKLWSF